MESRGTAVKTASAQKPKKDIKLIFDAIFSGDLNYIKKNITKIKKIINNLYIINMKKTGTIANQSVNMLFFAMVVRSWPIVEFLLENGANPNRECSIWPNPKPVTALQYFLHEMDEHSSNPPTTDQRNKILDLLLEYGGDFTRSAEIPNMFILCRSAYLISVTFFEKLINKMGLLAFEASLKEVPRMSSKAIEGREGFSPPLHLICQEGLLDHVELFLRSGVDPQQFIEDYATPLTACLMHLKKLDDALEIKRLEAVIELLIHYLGDKIKKPFSRGYTYLHVVAQSNQVVWIKRFIAMGLDVNARTDQGATAAYAAANLGHLEALQALAEIPHCDLKLGVIDKKPVQEVEKIDPRKSIKSKDDLLEFIEMRCTTSSPLLAAFGCGEEAVCRFLLTMPERAGKNELIASLRTVAPRVNKNGREFLSKFPEIESEIFTEKQNPLHQDSSIIEQCVLFDEEELAISQLRAFDKSKIDFPQLLKRAMQHARDKVIKYILKEFTEEVRENIKQDISYVTTAISCFCGIECLRLLLELGAPIINPEQTVSAVHCAVESENMPALLFLLSFNPACKDFVESGEPLLLTAALLNYHAGVSLLLGLQANPLAVCERRKTNALLHFMTEGKQKFVQKIIEYSEPLDLSLVHTFNHGMSYLGQAYTRGDESLFVALFKLGARDTGFLTQGKVLTWLHGLNHAEVMAWARQALEEKRAKMESRLSSPAASPQLELSSQGVSGRRFYRETFGVLPEESAPLESDSVYESKMVLFDAEPKPKPFTWFDDLSSEEKSVVAIRGGSNVFLYLDVSLLSNQGLEKETIDTLCVASALNGSSIRTLNFKHIVCKIRHNGSEHDSFLMAEMRFPHTNPELKEKRIFLWKVLDETKQATLLVGFELSDALHEQRDIRSLIQSYRQLKIIDLSARVSAELKSGLM